MSSQVDDDYKNPDSTGVSIPVTIRNSFKRLLFVAHRCSPYPGGTENFVKEMAEEAYNRGHEVVIFAGEHRGNVGAIRVTDDPGILLQAWDLIIVHGGDDWIRYNVLNHSEALGGPVLYLIINPSDLPENVACLHRAQFVGCSTLADWRYVESYDARARAVRVRHGIDPRNAVGNPGFRKLHNITTRYMFLSTGGFWPNKAFDELIGVFNDTQRTDTTLVLTGYDDSNGLMKEDTEFVKSFLFKSREYMLSAMIDADLYIMNSYTEGFGLGLLEAMLNMTPWASREIAGGEVMKEYGFTYTNPKDLQEYLRTFHGGTASHLLQSQTYVISTHLVKHTVSDILRVLA